jgi:hypothetical protein
MGVAVPRSPSRACVHIGELARWLDLARLISLPIDPRSGARSWTGEEHLRTRLPALVGLGLTLALSALLPLAVHAAGLPREGNDSFTNVWVATSLNTMQQGNRTFATYEIDGVARNDNGGPMFNSFGQRCLGLAEVMGNDVRGQGTCTYTDKDGDHIFMPYSAKGDGKGGERGTYEVVGGTGKFSGITGSGEYFNPHSPIKADDKALRGVVSNKVSWKLP